MNFFGIHCMAKRLSCHIITINVDISLVTRYTQKIITIYYLCSNIFRYYVIV